MKTLALLLLSTTCGAPTVRVCVPSPECGYYAEQCGVSKGYAVCEHSRTRELFKVKL